MEELMRGLPYWIAGGIIAIVMSVLVNRSKKKLSAAQQQEQEKKVGEDLQKRFRLKNMLVWMVAFPLAGGIIVFIILWYMAGLNQ